jgi:phosphatidylserine/phosphatidylglycerophosphate/cardiolipin synthase-like enzyme
MKRFFAFVVVSLLMLTGSGAAKDLTLKEVPTEVYYSPHGGAQDALVRHIDAAHESVYILAYSFTSGPITAALCRAVARGVRVEAVLDRSQRTAKGGQGQALADCGGHVAVDSRHAIAHNKIMVFDCRAVATGSFNFTTGAEARNAENLLILDSPELARLYREEWDRNRGHAAPW